MSTISLKSKQKYGTLLAGNEAYLPSYESIATVIVGSGGQSSVSFTSIPTTYTHLQIRGIVRKAFSSGTTALKANFNSDTGMNYTNHQLYGNGSSAGADGNATGTYSNMPFFAIATQQSDTAYGAFVVDILDYRNSNKYKTIRSFAGYETNSVGFINLASSLWLSTSAITSITLATYASGNIDQYSKFALYGLRSA